MGIANFGKALSQPLPVVKAERARPYYPNREPMMVLECGCIESAWLLIHQLAGKDYQYCERHHESESEWGQRILREASIAERVLFFWEGIPAPKRANNKSSSLMRALRDGTPDRARPDSEILF